jgi:arylsulfatase A-like enzyme
MKALVITADGLNLGYVGCYGNDWVETPALDLLAAEGVVFDQHIADRPDAAGARRSWRTAEYHLPRCRDGRAAPSDTDLIRTLSAQGFATAWATAGHGATPFDFGCAWDRQVRAGPGGEDALTGEAMDWLASTERGVLWLDYGSLVPPWILTPEYQARYLEGAAPETEEEAGQEATADLTPWDGPLPGLVAPADETTFLRLQRTYAAAVTRLDDVLDALLEGVTRRPTLSDLFIVFTSGHGLALGEHGQTGTELAWLHEELVHVPLILRLPHGAEAGRRVPALTQSIDAVPTLLDMLGLPAPRGDGRSLLPLARGETDFVRPQAVSTRPAAGATAWALRTAQWTLLRSVPASPGVPRPASRLFVKPDDRWEHNDLGPRYPEAIIEMEETLDRMLGVVNGGSAVNQPTALQ